MERRKYQVDLTINGISIDSVIIDPHYEKNHSESINDEIILKLVETLNDNRYEPDDVEVPYSYFVTDDIGLDGKLYKLIWLLEDNQIYVGVVNAYRRG